MMNYHRKGTQTLFRILVIAGLQLCLTAWGEGNPFGPQGMQGQPMPFGPGQGMQGPGQGQGFNFNMNLQGQQPFGPGAIQPFGPQQGFGPDPGGAPDIPAAGEDTSAEGWTDSGSHGTVSENSHASTSSGTTRPTKEAETNRNKLKKRDFGQEGFPVS